MKLVKIKEYAEIEKISIPKVYKRIEKGFIKVYKEGRSVFIEIDDGIKQESGNINIKNKESNNILNERIKHVEEMLKKEVEARERAEKREENLTHLLAMSNQNINNLSENIKALEHKTEVIEEELIKEKSKTIWQKIFRK
jgi:septation ring formation regulator EzrA